MPGYVWLIAGILLGWLVLPRVFPGYGMMGGMKGQ